MRIIILTTILVLISSLALATDFELSKIEERDEYTFIQLQYGVGGTPQPFSEILSQATINKEKIYVRILGEFSAETNQELISYYSKHIPNELQKALQSSGNLHNPTLEPLIKNFAKAFRTTRMFQDIEAELNKKGFSISEIEFEKYTIESKDPPRFWVADIWLKSK